MWSVLYECYSYMEYSIWVPFIESIFDFRVELAIIHIFKAKEVKLRIGPAYLVDFMLKLARSWSAVVHNAFFKFFNFLIIFLSTKNKEWTHTMKKISLRPKERRLIFSVVVDSSHNSIIRCPRIIILYFLLYSQIIKNKYFKNANKFIAKCVWKSQETKRNAHRLNK